MTGIVHIGVPFVKDSYPCLRAFEENVGNGRDNVHRLPFLRAPFC